MANGFNKLYFAELNSAVIPLSYVLYLEDVLNTFL